MPFVIDTEYHNEGIARRRAVLGDAHVDRALAGEHDLIEYLHVFGHEMAYAHIWGRTGISPALRSLCAVAMIAARTPAGESFRAHVRGAILNGASRREIRQVLAMLSFYLGAGVGTETIRTAWAELGADDGGERAEPQPVSREEVLNRGVALHEKLAGAAPKASLASSDPEEVYAALKLAYHFGVLWSDSDLSTKVRALVATSIACAANHARHVRLFLSFAKKAGCSSLEAKEVMLTASAYCGAMACEDGFDAVREVFGP